MLKKLLELYITFFKIGAVTFGGGYAMLPILERELVLRKKWATSEDLIDYYAISQVTPGVIAVNVSTFIGCKRHGPIGGFSATAGLVTPSIIIITIIALFISNFEDIVWVQKALAGINVAVTALVTYGGYNIARKSVKNIPGVFFYLFAFVSVYFCKFSSVIIIIASALLGLLFTLAFRKKKEDKK